LGSALPYFSIALASIVFGLAVTQVAMFATTVYMHRFSRGASSCVPRCELQSCDHLDHHRPQAQTVGEACTATTTPQETRPPTCTRLHFGADGPEPGGLLAKCTALHPQYPGPRLAESRDLLADR
jgi:hypothetical protein